MGNHTIDESLYLRKNVEEIEMIETERLILRPFLKSDFEDVFEYLKEPAVNCFTCMKLNSLEEARIEVAKREKETDYLFAIVLKETGKVIVVVNVKL